MKACHGIESVKSIFPGRNSRAEISIELRNCDESKPPKMWSALRGRRAVKTPSDMISDGKLFRRRMGNLGVLEKSYWQGKDGLQTGSFGELSAR